MPMQRHLYPADWGAVSASIRGLILRSAARHVVCSMRRLDASHFPFQGHPACRKPRPASVTFASLFCNVQWCDLILTYREHTIHVMTCQALDSHARTFDNCDMEVIAMTDESTAVLTEKFQVRMTPEERKMLEEITQWQWPGGDHLQSHMLRRLIREEHLRQQQREAEAQHE